MKKLLLLPLLISNLHAMELVPVSSNENVRLLTNHTHMYIEDENAAYCIKPHDMNRELRDVLKHKALSKFKEAGYIRANKQSDGTYTLCAKVRGNGGTGPITAGIVNMTVRVGCWTAYLLGVTTPAVAGAVVAGPAGASAGAAATTVALANIGGGVAVAAGIETLATKATLATLLLPIPLP